MKIEARTQPRGETMPDETRFIAGLTWQSIFFAKRFCDAEGPLRNRVHPISALEILQVG